MKNIAENSAESVLDFAFQAAGADGTVSSEELSLLLAEADLVKKMISSLGLLGGLSNEFLDDQNINLKNYLLKASAKKHFKFSKVSFEKAAENITASTLQPFALAFAQFVSAADGLDKKEFLVLKEQNLIWDCDQEDINYFIKQLGVIKK